MGLFDFLKPKKAELDDNLSQLLKAFFPKGELAHIESNLSN